MKSIFSFNDKNYISPTKAEARKFLRFYGQPREAVRRFKTTWKIKHVEYAPSYGQITRIGLDQVEYGKKQTKQR